MTHGRICSLVPSGQPVNSAKKLPFGQPTYPTRLHPSIHGLLTWEVVSYFDLAIA